MVIDSTGLKVFGEGEWQGQKTRRRETASVAQVASGGRPGDPRYRGSRSVIGECANHTCMEMVFT